MKKEKTGSSEMTPDTELEAKGEAKKHAGAKKRGIKSRAAELEEELHRVSSKASEDYERLLRARADFENLKKRTARDIELAHQRAGEDLVVRLLPILDDLEKAVAAAGGSPELKPMEEGLSLIHKSLLEALRESGVSAICPEGEPFDPNVHEAVLQRPAGGSEPGTVLEVLQKGYLMNGLVLRAAKVVVAAEEEE